MVQVYANTTSIPRVHASIFRNSLIQLLTCKYTKVQKTGILLNFCLNNGSKILRYKTIGHIEVPPIKVSTLHFSSKVGKVVPLIPTRVNNVNV